MPCCVFHVFVCALCVSFQITHINIGFVCLLWVNVVIEHIVNSKWFHISTSWAWKFSEHTLAPIFWVAGDAILVPCHVVKCKYKIEKEWRCIWKKNHSDVIWEKQHNNVYWMFYPLTAAVFKIRSESCRTKAQLFCQNLYMMKKESLPDRPKFCRSGSVVRHLFWKLLLIRNAWFKHGNGNMLPVP